MQESAPGRWPSDTALILRERASRQGGSLGGWPNTSSSIPEAQAAAQRLGFFRGEGGGRFFRNYVHCCERDFAL